MFRFKIFISVIIFSFLLVGTSIIKNNTRAIENKIYNSKNRIYIKERDLNESQLDYSYLTSPSILEQKIKIIDTEQYFPMKYSNIFLSMTSFTDLEKKIVIQEIKNEKIQKK